MKAGSGIRRNFIAFFLGLLGLLLPACQLTKGEEVRNTLSFDSLYDSLSRFDSVRIEIRDTAGNLLDLIYAGKIDAPAEIEDLAAPHWDGGKALIVISGYRNGSPDPIYKIEKRFDGRTDVTESDLVLIHPDVFPPDLIERVDASPDTLVLYKGGPGHVVTARAHPATAPSLVRWESTTPSVAAVSQLGEVLPLEGGLTYIIAVSLADSSKRDTIQVSVKVDAPKLRAGEDTLLTAGQSLAFIPAVTQEYGQIVQFKWDLDGNLEWDDSSATLREVSFTYDQVKEHVARFLVRDTEGNQTMVTVTIRVVKAAAVVIHSPANNLQTNSRVIAVDWSIDGVKQDSLLSENLLAGVNTISRSARDEAGSLSTASVTVILDTLPPSPPRLMGTSPTNVQPSWTWSSGGGTGEYRFRIGAGDFPADAPTTRDTAWVLKEPALAGTTYTLTVQERDPAGNWSASAVLAVQYDNTKPVVAILLPQASGTFYTAAATLALSGTALGPFPMARVVYSIDGGTEAPAVLGSKGDWSIPALPLSEGKLMAMVIRAVDSLGNIGEAGLDVLRDNAAPGAPVITVSPAPVIKTATGSWTWSQGNGEATGSGLNGNYRFKRNNDPWNETGGTSIADLLLKEGLNIFQVQAQDRAGNWSPSAIDTVKVDTRGPTVAITSPVATGGSYTSTAAISVEIGGTVADSGVGVKEVVCEWGVPAKSMVASLTGSNWKVTPTFNSGASTLWCTGYDQFDKAGISVSINITLAIPLPVISNLDVADGMVMNTKAFTVSYDVTVAGKTTRESTPVTLAEGVNSPVILTSKAVNLLGEPGTSRVTYVLRSKAVFVDRLAKGRGDGSSWANAHATVQEAAINPLFAGGGAQLWISKGDYAGTVDTVHLPSTGRILGGFNGAALPSDTSAAHRNPALHKAVLTNFLFSLDTLAGRFECNGLEMAGGQFNAILKQAPGNQSGAISLTGVTFRYPSYQNLNFKGSQAIRVEMIGCEALQADTLSLGNFQIAFEVPGTFVAKNSRFIRARRTGSYTSFLYANYTASTQYQSLEFENCELNYFVVDYRVINYQVFLANGSGSLAISKSKVYGGKARVYSAGTLSYDDVTNVTLP